MNLLISLPLSSARGRYLLMTLAVVLAASIIPGNVVRGQANRVQFDARSMVSCKDVTPESFAAANPHEKLIEARFLVTSLISPTTDDELLTYLYRIESPLRTFEVSDFLPKTTLATNIVGNVGVEKREEDATTFGLTVSGSYEKLAKGTASAGIDKKNFNGLRYEYLPKMELLSASGTINRGSGVYFKLKPSLRTSLEGEREFVVIMRTPRAWRADYVTVHCEAFGQRSALSGSFAAQPVVGYGRFYAALYSEGDPEAQLAARRFVRSDQILLDVAAAKRDEIDRHSLPTVMHKWGALVSLVNPKIDVNWLTRVRVARPGAQVESLVHRLPESVRGAAEAYLHAKWRLAELNGWSLVSYE